MSVRPLALAALVCVTSLGALAACNDVTRTISTNPNAVVRFVNASTDILDVTNNDTLLTDDSNLGYGGSTSCITVNPADPKLVFSETGTTAPIAYTPNFSHGRQYTVIAYRDANGGIRIASIDDTFRVGTGAGAANLFNAVPGSANITAMVGGTTVGSSAGVSFGNASGFTNVPVGDAVVSFSAGGSAANVPAPTTLTFYDDVRSTIIVAPSDTGAGYHAFSVTSC